MSKQVKLALVRRLLDKGLIFEAEVACIELNISRDYFEELRGN